MTDRMIVNAISARIDGQFQNPDLRKLGGLRPDRLDDVIRLLAMRNQATKATDGRRMIYMGCE